MYVCIYVCIGGDVVITSFIKDVANCILSKKLTKKLITRILLHDQSYIGTIPQVLPVLYYSRKGFIHHSSVFWTIEFSRQ